MFHDCHVKRDKTHTSVTVYKCCGATSQQLSAEKRKWDWTCTSGFHSGRPKHCGSWYKSNRINKAWALRRLWYQCKFCTNHFILCVHTKLNMNSHIKMWWSCYRYTWWRQHCCMKITTAAFPAQKLFFIQLGFWRPELPRKNFNLNHKRSLKRGGGLLRLLWIAEEELAAFCTSIHLPQASARLQTGLRVESGAQEEKLEEASGQRDPLGDTLKQRCEKLKHFQQVCKGQKDQNIRSSTTPPDVIILIRIGFPELRWKRKPHRLPGSFLIKFLVMKVPGNVGEKRGLISIGNLLYVGKIQGFNFPMLRILDVICA